MAITTIYDVTTRYKADDQASGRLSSIASAADRAGASTGRLTSSLRDLGAIALGGGVLMGAKKGIVDFNSELEQAQISIAAADKAFTGRDFGTAMGRASDQLTAYQEDAKKSTATTMEFVKAQQFLASSLYRAGANDKQMRDIVTGSVTAAPIALPGVDSETAMRDIQSMLSGQVNAKDRFAKMLLDIAGVGIEQFNKRAKKDPKYALDITARALQHDAFKDARKAQEKSFGGAASTFTDNVQIMAAKASLPVFEGLRSTLVDINAYIEKNAASIQRVGSAMGSGIVDGFRFAGLFVANLAEHATALVSIAGAFAVFKGVSMVGAGIGGLQAVITGIAMAAGTATVTLGGIAAAALPVITALGALYLAAQAIATWVGKKRTANIGMEEDFLNSRINGQYSRNNADQLLEYVKEHGALTNVGGVDLQKLTNQFQAAGSTTRPDILASKIANIVEAGIPLADRMKKTGIVEGPVEGPKTPKDRSNRDRQNISVRIERIEVATDDPDRFVVGMTRSFRKMADAPTQAASAFGRSF